MYLFRISFALLLCFSFSGLLSQVNLMIRGTVEQPVDSLVTLIIPPTSLGGESSRVSTRLSPSDEFRFAIKTDIATPAFIVHGGFKIPIFIVPDQSFSLECTAGKGEFNEVLFAGPGGADNTFFYEYLKFIADKAPPIDSNRLARSTAKEYRRLMDENRAAREDFLETGKLEIAPQLLRWLQNDVAYTYATELLRYPSVFQDLHDGTRSRTPSSGYYSFLEGMQLNNPDAILQESYQRFLESFIIYKLERPMGWELRTGGKTQYAILNRFLFGSPLYYMQHLVFERTLNWLVDPDYMAKEYQSFMISEAPELLKQQLKELKENPPKFYSMKSFSIVGGPVLWEVFQLHDGNRPDSSFFKGQPSLFYFLDRRLSRVTFATRYLKKLKRNLTIHRDMNICLVDVNGDFEEWQKLYFSDRYAKHPITHLSLNYFDELFDTSIEQGVARGIILADANGIIIETLDWKPPVKRVLEIINRRL